MSPFNLAELFLDTNLADITFVVEDEDIPGHRVIFASSYPYFKNMLVGDEESQEKRFQMKNTSAKAFKEVKRFIYLGQLDTGDWNIEDLLDLLALTKDLQLEDVFSKVIEALKMQPLDFDSWHSLKSAASVYASIALEAKCVSFAEEKWTDFLQLKDLDKFTTEFLCFMFGCPKVFIDTSRCNQDVFCSAVAEWKMHKSEEELRSFNHNIQKASNNTFLTLCKVFFPSQVKTYRERQLRTQPIPDLEKPSQSNVGVKRVRLSNEEKVEQPLECFIRVDSVVLSKFKHMEFQLLNNKGRLVITLNPSCVTFAIYAPTHGSMKISVNRIELEADTKFSLQYIDGLEGKPTFKAYYMCSSGPTSKSGWFKYRGVFSPPKSVFVLHVKSPDFENMSEIRLRNLAIY